MDRLILDKIVSKFGLDNTSFLLEKKFNENIEYINALKEDTGEEVAYIIVDWNDDCSLIYKDLKKANEFIEKNDSSCEMIFVFDDYEEEEKVKQNLIDMEKLAKGKKQVRILFQNKISFFRNGGKIKLRVDNGINYLEYLSCAFQQEEDKDNSANQNMIKGYIYNISYFELKKLFKLAGYELFRENVRKGEVKPNLASIILKKEFDNYLKNGIIDGLKKRNFDTTNIESLITSGESKYKLEMFWFCHNGVTIYIDDSEYDSSGDYICFDSNNANVLNGAQTMTNLYDLVFERRKDLISHKESIKDNLGNKLENKILDDILDDICKRIWIKTIIIVGNNENIEYITKGLNTQIPISTNDRLSLSRTVFSINEKLTKKGIRIIRAGEQEDAENIPVLKFAKKTAILLKQPGVAKNLGVKQVEDMLKKAKEMEASELAEKLKGLIDVDAWWAENANYRKKNYEDKVEEIIQKYGSNYFASYVIEKCNNNYEENNLSRLYAEYLFYVKKAIEDLYDLDELGANTFKNDNLYKTIIEISNKKEKENKSDFELGEEKKELIDYLNDNGLNKAASVMISRFYKERNISLPEYRTIRAAQKDDSIINQECMPFASDTFFEISESKEYNIRYEDSLFAKEVLKEYLLFVLVCEDKVVKDIIAINNFSFRDYQPQAKEVFEDTVRCFKEGVDTFIKISDNKSFHVRPKARDKDDVFEFSDGRYITKRTFWANKDIVTELINK